MEFTEVSSLQDDMNQKIERIVQESQIGDSFRMQEITGFPWQRLCVFSEGTPTEILNQVLGLDWAPVDHYIMSRQHLIFINNESVPLHFPTHRSIILSTPDTYCLSHEMAIFEVGLLFQPRNDADGRALFQISE